MTTKKVINPSYLFDSTPFGFSQIVITDPGKLVFISGQVAWDRNYELIGEDDLSKQTEKSLNNLRTAIEAAGGTLQNIVMLRIYVIQLQQEHSVIITDQLKKFFGDTARPASTWLQVNKLANDKFLIEIEAQAVIW